MRQSERDKVGVGVTEERDLKNSRDVEKERERGREI